MISGDYPGLATVGDIGTTHPELMNAAMPFFNALYWSATGNLHGIYSLHTVHKEEEES